MRDRFTFEFILVPGWPCLAWLARCAKGSTTVTVFHGDRVETREEWFGEILWDGEFSTGDFDMTDIVCGSGARIRGNQVIFVPSGSTVDRLNFIEGTTVTWVSNSLACLMSSTKTELDPTYRGYFNDLQSITNGLLKYQSTIRTASEAAKIQYFDNLSWDGTSLRVCRKPSPHRDLSTFSEYRDFLRSSFHAVTENMKSGERRHSLSYLGTLSSGYDSATISTIASSFGCKEVIGFDSGRLGEDDSGAPIAKVLGLTLYNVNRNDWQTKTMSEVAFLAGDALGADVIFNGAETYLFGRVLLTGFHGDKVWSKSPGDLSPNIVRGDSSGLDLSEYRLAAGFLNCAVPFWGVKQIADINRISLSDELKHWDVPGEYSRPICRRIVEEAGVPREIFGTAKKASADLFTTSESFLTPSSMDDYFRWLSDNTIDWWRRGKIPPLRSATFDRYKQMYRNRVRWGVVEKRLLWRIADTIDHSSTALRSPLFPWAVSRMAERYAPPF
jgi:hypothetical protein